MNESIDDVRDLDRRCIANFRAVKKKPAGAGFDGALFLQLRFTLEQAL